ncbi:MAG: hypothetical protein HY471_01710 [Candidatus Sungbacteria bacterium]|nr:hypothetical protein [Candidatus Sungbacteria bacterium]
MLIEFYGDECLHCARMAPLVEKLKEEGIEITQYEVWNNEENARKMTEYSRGLCEGVPFFVNTETKSFICGEVSYEELKAWVTGT